MNLQEYCFHGWTGQCPKLNQEGCNRQCENYRPVHLHDRQDLTDFQDRARQGDILATIILAEAHQRIEVRP